MKKSGPKKTIKVLVADDHGLVRDSLKTFLDGEKGMKVVAVCNDGSDCVLRAAQHKPDVILMDIKLPGLNGIEATRMIKGKGLPSLVLIVSAYTDELHVREAFRAGADGYITKSAGAGEILAAIAKLYKEKTYVPPSILPAVLEGLKDRDPCARAASCDITAQETRILGLMKEGLSNKEIAKKLNIGEQTVKNRSNILFAKLNVKRRTEAVAKAHRIGLISLD